jgi:hypothetical protein
VGGHVRYVCAVLVHQSEVRRCAHGGVKAILHLVQILVLDHGVSNLRHRAANHARPIRRSLNEAESCLRLVVDLSVGQQRSVHALARRPAIASP